MNSYPCPKCKEPVYILEGRCWHCGWNTASYKEQVHSCFGRSLSELIDEENEKIKKGIEWILDDAFQKEYEKKRKWVGYIPLEPLEEKKLTGLSSSYYELPKGCKELQDLIEYKNMNFARGNIFKATYRLGDKPGTDQIYDYEKIIWFAQREIERLKNAEKSAD